MTAIFFISTCKMVLMTSVLSALLSMQCVAHVSADICHGAHCFGGRTGDPRPCTGAHCPESRSPRVPREFNPATQWRSGHAAVNQHHAYTSQQRAPLQTDPSAPLMRGRHGDGGGCTDADCTVKQLQQPRNETRDCRGIECRLPLRIRPKALGRSCVGEGCPAVAEEMSPLYLSDRAAQILGDYPELGHTATEIGGPPSGVQLTCDIKPGLVR